MKYEGQEYQDIRYRAFNHLIGWIVSAKTDDPVAQARLPDLREAAHNAMCSLSHVGFEQPLTARELGLAVKAAREQAEHTAALQQDIDVFAECLQFTTNPPWMGGLN